MTNAGDLPPLRDVITAHGLAARKSLGQHFLLDLNITRKITRVADVGPEDTVLEIGPGPGGLTRALLETGASVIAVERDRRCLAALEDLASAYSDKLQLVNADAMEVNERDLVTRSPVKIVANLPYNISAPLLIKWLRENAKPTPLWSRMALMFQAEVADRILAAPGGKTYGRLSVMAQATSKPARAFDLPARAFTPPPKVDSSVVLFEPAPIDGNLFTALEQVAAAAFAQRRKMARKALAPIFGDNTSTVLEKEGLESTVRPETIDVEAYLRLARTWLTRR